MDVVKYLSADPILLAIANVTALIGAILIIYKISRTILIFLRSAYRSNVKVAYYRLRRDSYLLAKFCAYDIHHYISTLSQRAMLIFMMGITIPIGFYSNVKSRQKFIDFPPKINISYDDYVKLSKIVANIQMLTQITLIIGFMLILVLTFKLSSNVVRIRGKWYRRRHIRTQERAMSEVTSYPSVQVSKG
jgi:hypothetical protein